MFGPYRIAGNLPTRNPQERPEEIEIVLHFGPGTERITKMIPAAKYPIIATAIPELELAGVLTNAPSTDRYKFIPRILQMWRRHPEQETADPTQQYELTREIPMTQFAMLLAKIAHSYAVAELGLDAFDYLLPPVILGERLNLPDYVGGTEALKGGGSLCLGPEGKQVEFLIQHYLNLEKTHSVDGTHYLTVVVGLLNPFCPKYRIIVAKC
jgi:hypothetical protein